MIVVLAVLVIAGIIIYIEWGSKSD